MAMVMPTNVELDGSDLQKLKGVESSEFNPAIPSLKEFSFQIVISLIYSVKLRRKFVKGIIKIKCSPEKSDIEEGEFVNSGEAVEIKAIAESPPGFENRGMEIIANEQCVIGKLYIANKGSWIISTVYGSRDVYSRRSLWDCLRSHSSLELPYVIGGDFNCILSQDDNRGGKKFKFSLAPQEMNSFMNSFDLHDVGMGGPKYTWCNNKSGGARIWERLDRCLLNSKALEVLPHAVNRRVARHPKISSLKTCGSLILLHFTLSRKLGANNSERILWRSKHKSLKELKETLTKEVDDLKIEEANGIGMSEQSVLLLKSKVHELNSTLARLNVWWRQRVKLKWIKESDINSQFFHAFANGRKNGNFIKHIKDDMGNLERDCIVTGWPNILNAITSESVKLLDAEFTMEEVEKVISNLGRNISIGNDGISYSFITGYWKIIAHDIREAIFQFISMGKMNNKWKETLIVLIPKVQNLIEAKSGFRQGCPLSPYLFILCSQPISNNLHYNGNNLGIKVAALAPKISHLLYADDVLLFFEANIEQVKVLKRIIVDYCSWIGLSVNVKKTAIMFGKSVNIAKKKSLSKILNYKVVQEMKYLGINLYLRRLISSDFLFLLEMALAKISSWGNKFFSLPGRIVLVKSVLLAIPIFYVSHSLTPINILKKLEKICREFIWKKADNDDRMHYISWEVLCKPFAEGRAGLLSPVAMMGPLRSKYAWEFLKESNSLLYRTLRAKYGNVICSGTKKQNCSVTWKILLNGLKSLHPILRWKVATGVSIDPLEDIWIQNKRLSNWPMFVNVTVDEFPILDFFIQNREWKLEELNKYFGPELTKSRNNVTHGDNELGMGFMAAKAIEVAVTLSKCGILSDHWGANQLYSNKAGIASVFRDNKGRFLFAFGIKCVHWDIGLLELLAIRALNLFHNKWTFEAKGIIIEGDNQNVINYLQRSLNKASHKNYEIEDLSVLEDF
ncbi:uncharacterized protein LOC114579055 [Dendrobium catenatum]|uniref:uncharacterized protein LOC114579055 n=1 Tax=Dendrobium catenatum TaxID=906689 RepID=UPI00109F1919|nr:uncharacterized protein LOC114579055 [Dendrobium catenatum]